MSQDSRHAAPRVRLLPWVLAVVLALGVGLVVGHVSRDHEVSGLRADASRSDAAAAEARQVALKQAHLAAAAGRSSYVATALSHHSAGRSTLALRQARQALRTAAACRAAMRTEMNDVTVLLDILDRDDPVYTVKRLKDVDPDAAGIRACAPGAVGSPVSVAPAAPHTSAPPTVSPVVLAKHEAR